jgi:hypothetical protein
LISIKFFSVETLASCRNAVESLQAIRDLSPDMALLDTSMPIALGTNALADRCQQERLYQYW